MLFNASNTKSFWLAFIDIDEFIVPLSTGNIPDFLHPFERAAGIEINWVLYGNSGQEKKTEGLVMERFTQHATWDFIINYHVKSIVNPRLVARMYAHHADYLFNNISLNSNGDKKLFAVYKNESPCMTASGLIIISANLQKNFY